MDHPGAALILCHHVLNAPAGIPPAGPPCYRRRVAKAVLWPSLRVENPLAKTAAVTPARVCPAKAALGLSIADVGKKLVGGRHL